jgi:hypothetical protein
MEEKEKLFDVKRMPLSWQVCFLSECPVKEQCLRQLAVGFVSDERDFGPAVYPTMKVDEHGCRLFVKAETKRMAWGFKTLFSDVKSRHEQALRNSLKVYLGGHSSFYRYNRGERLLNTEQQDWILNLFRQYGYTDNLTFDHFVETYEYE